MPAECEPVVDWLRRIHPKLVHFGPSFANALGDAAFEDTTDLSVIAPEELNQVIEHSGVSTPRSTAAKIAGTRFVNC